MKTIEFWFDPISPYGYLAFERLPQALAGLSVVVDYRPLLLGAVLAHWGQKGPAEIDPKRAWMHRELAWRAARDGVPFQAPAVHPFNPLPLLRLALACSVGGRPSRHVVERLFHHVWRSDGADATEPQRLAALTEALAPARAVDGAEVKAELRRSTDDAIARGVFGVPTFDVDGRLFFGDEGMQMLVGHLRAEPWFTGSAWDDAAAPQAGLHRPR